MYPLYLKFKAYYNRAYVSALLHSVFYFYTQKMLHLVKL